MSSDGEHPRFWTSTHKMTLATENDLSLLETNVGQLRESWDCESFEAMGFQLKAIRARCDDVENHLKLLKELRGPSALEVKP